MAVCLFLQGCVKSSVSSVLNALPRRTIGRITSFLLQASLSFQLLVAAMETIPLATTYAVWTGIGTVGAAIVGLKLTG